MKTPTRILVGGPEVTSAFVLMGLSLARKAMLGDGEGSASFPSPLRARVGVRGSISANQCLGTTSHPDKGSRSSLASRERLSGPIALS